jgi:hypothetical protein
LREAGVVLSEVVGDSESTLEVTLKIDTAALGNLRRRLPADLELEIVEQAAEPREPAGLD